MKLKQFVEEIEINEYNEMANIFVSSLYEAFSKDFDVPLMEDLTTNCVYKTHADGSKGSDGIKNGIDDETLKQKLTDIKSGASKGWENVMNKQSCLQAIVSQLSGVKADCPPSKSCPPVEACDKRTDNQAVRTKVVNALTKAKDIFRQNADKFGGMAKRGAHKMLDLLDQELTLALKVDELNAKPLV